MLSLCPFDISACVGAFVIGPSQISCFLSSNLFFVCQSRSVNLVVLEGRPALSSRSIQATTVCTTSSNTSFLPLPIVYITLDCTPLHLSRICSPHSVLSIIVLDHVSHLYLSNSCSSAILLLATYDTLLQRCRCISASSTTCLPFLPFIQLDPALFSYSSLSPWVACSLTFSLINSSAIEESGSCILMFCW